MWAQYIIRPVLVFMWLMAGICLLCVTVANFWITRGSRYVLADSDQRVGDQTREQDWLRSIWHCLRSKINFVVLSFKFAYVRNINALEVLRIRALQIDIYLLNYLPTADLSTYSFPGINVTLHFCSFYFSLSFISFTYFLLLSIPSLSTRIVPLRFQAGGRRRRPNLGLVCVLLCNLCYLYSFVKMDCGVLFYLV